MIMNSFGKVLKVLQMSIGGCLLLGATSSCGASCPITVPGETSKASLQNAMEYIERTYLSACDVKKSFQIVYGDPCKARVVLILFTSLDCPVCAELHSSLFPALHKILNQYPQNFSIIERDYPANALSLKGSSMLWSVPEDLMKKIRDVLLRAPWIKETEEDTLKNLMHIAQSVCVEDKHKKALEGAVEDKSLLSSLFEARQRDKEALGISEVPSAWLFIRNKKGLSEMIALPDINNPETEKIIQEKLTSPH